MAFFVRPVACSPRLAHVCAQPLTTRFSRACYSSKPTRTDTQTKVAKQTSKLLEHVDPALIEYAESFHKNKKNQFQHCGLSIPGTPDHDRAVQNFVEWVEKIRSASHKKN